MDLRDARAELWRRFDAGRLSADELESRLQLLDAAGAEADEAAVAAALDGPLPLRRRRSLRRAALVASGVAAAAVVVAGAAVVVGALSSDGASEDRRFDGGGAGVDVPVPLPEPLPPNVTVIVEQGGATVEVRADPEPAP